MHIKLRFGLGIIMIAIWRNGHKDEYSVFESFKDNAAQE